MDKNIAPEDKHPDLHEGPNSENHPHQKDAKQPEKSPQHNPYEQACLDLGDDLGLGQRPPQSLA